MEKEIRQVQGLPENAYRELAPGEVYEPIIPAEARIPEVTPRSVITGIIMSVIFSGAAAFIALKLGQGIETAIPIAILTVGISAILKKKTTLLENVNILAVGATSGIVVGGSVFTMPAVYVLGLESYSNFFQIFIVPFLGAVLGVLFLIPFRRYFVADMHGKLPFPEGTATTEVLVAGEKGGEHAKVLAYSMGIGAAFDFLVLSLGAWRETFTTAIIGAFGHLTENVKAVFSLNTTAAIAGLGYIIGVRYASIILSGSVLSMLVIVPLFAHLGNYIHIPLTPGLPLLSKMKAEDIFYNYARYIGIGGIFAAGVMSILKMLPIIIQASASLFREIAKATRQHSAKISSSRIDIDMNMTTVLGLIVLFSVLIWLYFRFSVLANEGRPATLATLSVIVTLVISFLFASVSAWAVAMISVTPISGMTLMTLVVSALALARLGLSGPTGMLATLLIGGVVCTALSMTGSLVTQFKIGYWLGSTPKTIQWANIMGCVIASAVVTVVIILLNQVYGFSVTPAHSNPLPAPQANAMAAVITSMMGGGQAPWFFYGLGAVIAVLVEMLGVSSLAFALGMYLPMDLNTPILLGAIVAYLVQRSHSSYDVCKARNDRGILISSGLIAGGALSGVLGSLLRWLQDYTHRIFLPNFENTGAFGNWIGLFMFIGICLYMYGDSCRAKVTTQR